MASQETGGFDHQDQDEEAELHHRHPADRHKDGDDPLQSSQDQPPEQGPQGVAQPAQDADDKGLFN